MCRVNYHEKDPYIAIKAKNGRYFMIYGLNKKQYSGDTSNRE